MHLEKQIAEEKDEVKRLKAKHDELEAHEQQLQKTVEDDENEDEENE